MKHLLATIKCSICGQHYEISDVSVLGHQEDLWFVGAFCSGCHTQALVAAVVKENSAVITDLTEEEFSRLQEGKPVQTEDLLEIHSFLKGFSGDFSRLFSRKGKARGKSA